MILYLVILLLTLPFVDLFILVRAAGLIGFWQTVGLVLLTGVIGALFVKREAKTVWRRLGTSVTANEMSRNLLEGILIVLGGLMLLSPGFVTDGIGFTLVMRWSRTRITLKLEEKLKEKGSFQVKVGRL